MLIGITGSLGGGKGESVRGTDARPCQLVCELANKTSDKVYRACKAHVPYEFSFSNLSLTLC